MSPAAGALAACSKASSSGVSCLQYEHCSMKRVTVIYRTRGACERLACVSELLVITSCHLT
jgi:hypothetical protein